MYQIARDFVLSRGRVYPHIKMSVFCFHKKILFLSIYNMRARNDCAQQATNRWISSTMVVCSKWPQYKQYYNENCLQTKDAFTDDFSTRKQCYFFHCSQHKNRTQRPPTTRRRCGILEDASRYIRQLLIVYPIVVRPWTVTFTQPRWR